jgi:hypothetical protein
VVGNDSLQDMRRHIELELVDLDRGEPAPRSWIGDQIECQIRRVDEFVAEDAR